MSALLLMATTKKEPKPPKCKKSGKSLRLACEIGDISMLESALKRKKDTGINQHDTDGRYPLHIAVQKGWTDLVGRLVRAGADVNAINTRSNLWNVLHYAAHSRNKELFSYLVGVPEMQGS
jgi:ankyrin repeat protein